MLAAPSLLSCQPSRVPVLEARMAVVGHADHTVSVNRLPGPIATHLNALPNHAIACIHCRWRGALTAFPTLRAAPMLLLGRPGTEEIVEGSVAIEWIFPNGMHLTTCVLDRAASTNIALHLHLAVGQFAAVLLAAEDMVARPMDAVDALGALTLQMTHRVALQG